MNTDNLSIDGEGCRRLKKIAFEAYNEITCLIEVVERYKKRT